MAMGGVLLDLEGVLYQDGRPIDGVTRIHLAAPPGLAEDVPEAVAIGDLHADFSWRV